MLQLLTCLGAAMLALARQVPSGSKRRPPQCKIYASLHSVTPAVTICLPSYHRSW